jgi:Domain of unknown function (DUF6438)
MSHSLVLAVVAGLLTACSRPLAPRPTSARADSLVLERTRCYGGCPAYRVSLTARGYVAFASRNPGDSTRGADTVPVATLPSLVERASRLGFFRLPNRLLGDSVFCTVAASDGPTTTLTIYGASGAKTVEDYSGCFSERESIREPLRQLRALETAVDSLTGARRWIRRP